VALEPGAHPLDLSRLETGTHGGQKTPMGGGDARRDDDPVEKRLRGASEVAPAFAEISEGLERPGTAGRDAHGLPQDFHRAGGPAGAIEANPELGEDTVVAVMDGDLQDPPELTPDLVAAWREGYNAIYTLWSQGKKNPSKHLIL